MPAIQDLAMTHALPRRHHRQSGRSLIELMIAMVIGLVVLGAVLMTSISSNRTSAVNTQVARMQQDATFITQLLTSQLRLAGYSAVAEKPVLRAPIPEILSTNTNYGGPPVVGCENGFANVNAVDYTALACIGGGANAAPDAISIIYEGDTSNTFPTAGNPNQPTDCLGASVAPTVLSSSPVRAASIDPFYARIENRFFIRGTTLFCLGNGNLGNPQPVLDNVLDMQITYGVADTPGPGNRLGINDPLKEAVSYRNANQVNNMAPFPEGVVGPEARWNRVVSATVCLVLQSDLGALDLPTPYTNCQGNVITPPAGDTRAYRQVRIQVGFKNRTPPCPDASLTAAGRSDRCDISL